MKTTLAGILAALFGLLGCLDSSPSELLKVRESLESAEGVRIVSLAPHTFEAFAAPKVIARIEFRGHVAEFWNLDRHSRVSTSTLWMTYLDGLRPICTIGRTSVREHGVDLVNDSEFAHLLIKNVDDALGQLEQIHRSLAAWPTSEESAKQVRRVDRDLRCWVVAETNG